MSWPFINQLEDKDKELILNTTLSNKTVKDYAEMHNLNYSSTKHRLQRARKKLHSLFVECCELESDKYGNII
ncbi:MAG: RNA polymerase sigma-70 factor (ECF subfamily) [Sphingobacteriales bacterium]|jgi:RNA polymerase sigma-70 factor (ECF subfamily)